MKTSFTRRSLPEVPCRSFTEMDASTRLSGRLQIAGPARRGCLPDHRVAGNSIRPAMREGNTAARRWGLPTRKVFGTSRGGSVYREELPGGESTASSARLSRTPGWDPAMADLRRLPVQMHRRARVRRADRSASRVGMKHAAMPSGLCPEETAGNQSERRQTSEVDPAAARLPEVPEGRGCFNRRPGNEIRCLQVAPGRQ